jgi:hypothetical protein
MMNLDAHESASLAAPATVNDPPARKVRNDNAIPAAER